MLFAQMGQEKNLNFNGVCLRRSAMLVTLMPYYKAKVLLVKIVTGTRKFKTVWNCVLICAYFNKIYF